MSASPHVRVDIADAVATVFLDRPESGNAWSPEMERELFDAVQAAVEDPAVRAVVVTGAGRAFCSGPALEAIAPDRIEEFVRDPRGDTFFTSLPKPVVAAVNGTCVGIGLSMALMCDVRFAARDAKFTTGFARVGLVAEHGTAWLLQRLANPAVALDLLLSARVFLGEEAQAMGLVNFVVDREDTLRAAQDYARSLGRDCSPTAMAVIKRQVYGDSTSSLAHSVHEADRLVAVAAGSDDFANGIDAMVRGERPQHGPLDHDQLERFWA